MGYVQSGAVLASGSSTWSPEMQIGHFLTFENTLQLELDHSEVELIYVSCPCTYRPRMTFVCNL